MFIRLRNGRSFIVPPTGKYSNADKCPLGPSSPHVVTVEKMTGQSFSHGLTPLPSVSSLDRPTEILAVQAPGMSLV